MGIFHQSTFANLTRDLLDSAEPFSCGNDDLDDFFFQDSFDYASSLFGKSYCFYVTRAKTIEIICAFTVSNASIFTNRLPNARKKKVGEEVPSAKRDLIYPAVFIGRLGVNVKYQRNGERIGTCLLDFIKFWFTEQDNKTGCRYLVVDAYNSKVPLTFYQKNGFKQLFSTEEQEKVYRNISVDGPLNTRLMFYDLIRMVDF